MKTWTMPLISIGIFSANEYCSGCIDGSGNVSMQCESHRSNHPDAWGFSHYEFQNVEDVYGVGSGFTHDPMTGVVPRNYEGRCPCVCTVPAENFIKLPGKGEWVDANGNSTDEGHAKYRIWKTKVNQGIVYRFVDYTVTGTFGTATQGHFFLGGPGGNPLS